MHLKLLSKFIFSLSGGPYCRLTDGLLTHWPPAGPGPPVRWAKPGRRPEPERSEATAWLIMLALRSYSATPKNASSSYRPTQRDSESEWWSGKLKYGHKLHGVHKNQRGNLVRNLKANLAATHVPRMAEAIGYIMYLRCIKRSITSEPLVKKRAAMARPAIQ